MLDRHVELLRGHVLTGKTQMQRIPVVVWLITLSGLVVGAGRFLVPGHDLSGPGTYEAFAHIWVGVLLVLCFPSRLWDQPQLPGQSPWLSVQRTALVWLVLLTGLETVMFLLRNRG